MLFHLLFTQMSLSMVILFVVIVDINDEICNWSEIANE